MLLSFFHTFASKGLGYLDALLLLLSLLARWYISNVSIISDCSMLLYYLIWMIMGFNMHFYIIFGTNLLTQSLVPVFSLVSVFHRKGISNRVQTEWNLRERDFWNERDPGDLELKSRKLQGDHGAGRRACPPGRAPTLVGPSWLPWPTSFAYIYSHTLSPEGELLPPRHG